MATSFLPQPGDGAWLLQPGSRRGGGGQKVLRSFLREDPAGYEQDQTLKQHNTATNRLASFLPPTTYLPTSWAQRLDEPRTIADEKLLSTNDQDQGARAPPPASSSFQLQPTAISHTSTPTHEYTLQYQPTHAAEPMAPATTTKALPPHLRPRPESATSSHPVISKSGPESRTGSDTIREKLASDFGVKVSEPRPASPLVPYPASEDEWGTLSKAAADSTKASEQDGVKINGTAEAVQEQPPPPARKRAPSPVNRGRGRGGKATPRDTRWPKTADTRADPNRWVTNWGSEKSFSSTIDSAQADSGFGEGKKKRGKATDGGFKLTDWAGSWAPAPIDWDARPAFRDPHKLADIDNWMARIDEEMCGITREIPIEKITAVGDVEETCAVNGVSPTMKFTTVGDEMIPRYWVPITFPRNLETKTFMAPQTFWKEVIIKSDAPNPIHEDDLKDAKPWWELLQAPESVFLKPYDHPAINGIDPDENTNERLARENDEGGDKHAQNRRRTELAKRDVQRERRKKAQEKARKFSESVPVENRERVKPGLNIFLRSARPADMARIRDIYNHYIDFTCCTPETERRTTADMSHRLNDVLANRLPFLVACERGGKVPSRRKKRNPEDDLVLADKVVGFAFADDYNDMTGMYRFTAEVEVYTDNQHYMKGIAKCLLDKLMGMLDPDYLERGGYDIQGEELEGIGPSRVIKNIIMNVPYDKPERLEWLSRWLSGWLGFEQKGNLDDIGFKNGKSVSLAVFKRQTGATVDATNLPISTGYPS